MPTQTIDSWQRRQWLQRCAARLAAIAAGAAPALAAARAPRGDASQAMPLLLARDWVPGDDPAGWLVSEKLDGVRALWDGQRLRFRSGRTIAAPAGFLARLPPVALDGELWLGRGRFDELSGRVRRQAADAHDWQDLRFMVFELPGAAGHFAERARQLQAITRGLGWPALQAVPQYPVADAAALAQRLADVVGTGGEGLMLHWAQAPVIDGRSAWLRKFKPLSDAEAVVVGHLPGQGALAGQLGALQVRDAQGRRFDIGTGFDAATRRQPPVIGQRITYTHRGLTGQGLPRFASYLRLAPGF